MSSQNGLTKADWCQAMILRVLGLAEAPWTGHTKAALLELLKAEMDGHRVSVAKLGELIGCKERAASTAVRELQSLRVGEWVQGRGSRPGAFVFNVDIVEGLTGGPLDLPKRPDKTQQRGGTARARASRTSTMSFERTLLRDGVPADEAAARTEALDDALTCLRAAGIPTPPILYPRIDAYCEAGVTLEDWREFAGTAALAGVKRLDYLMPMIRHLIGGVADVDANVIRFRLPTESPEIDENGRCL